MFAKANSQENGELQAANLALRNCIKIEQLDDPILPIKAILARVTRNEIRSYYGVENFETVDQFLLLLARRFGKLKKGGIPDTYAAAKQILNDWNIGKIKYYTCPPDIHDLPAYISTELIGEFSKGFDLNEDEATEEFKDTNSGLSSGEMMVKEDEEPEKIEEDRDEFDEVLKKDTVIRFKNKKAKYDKRARDYDDLLTGMQLNKQLNLNFKRQKRKQKRTIKISEKMSRELEEGLKLF